MVTFSSREKARFYTFVVHADDTMSHPKLRQYHSKPYIDTVTAKPAQYHPDHLNEPVYLHPDAPQGTHSGPGKPHPPHNTSHTLPLIGPTKKLLGEQLEEVTATVKKLDIDEDKD